MRGLLIRLARDISFVPPPDASFHLFVSVVEMSEFTLTHSLPNVGCSWVFGVLQYLIISFLSLMT